MPKLRPLIAGFVDTGGFCRHWRVKTSIEVELLANLSEIYIALDHMCHISHVGINYLPP